MTNLTADEVRYLAKLSKIALTDEEVDKFKTELSGILGHIDQLGKVNTEGVKPTYQVTGLKNISREDNPDFIDYKVLPADLLKNVAETEDGMIKVPKVL